MVFLSQPGKGIFAADSSVNSYQIDNQLAILDPGGKPLRQESYGKTFNLIPYDFAPVFTMSGFKDMRSGKDGKNLVLFEFQNFQGMYPSALVLDRRGIFSVLSSPGSIRETRVLKNTTRATSLLVLGNNNLVSHLAYLTEWNISPAAGRHWEIIPSYNQEPKDAPADFLVFVPPDTRIIENHWLNRGYAVLFDKQEQEAITVHRDGKLELNRKGKILLYRDRPEILARAYGLIDESIRQKTIHRNPEKALELIGKAVDLPVQNPYLRSALLYLKGDCETGLGRYGAGKTSLEEALHYFPRNNDAMQRLLEIVFFEQGPLPAIETMERSFSQGQNFFGLGNVGMRLFLGNLHLAAGQMEKAREYFEKIYQENYPYARNPLSGILEMFRGNLRAGLPLSAPGRSPAARFFHRQGIQAVPGPQHGPGPSGTGPRPLDPGGPGQVLPAPGPHDRDFPVLACWPAREKRTRPERRIGPAFEKLKKTARGRLRNHASGSGTTPSSTPGPWSFWAIPARPAWAIAPAWRPIPIPPWPRKRAKPWPRENRNSAVPFFRQCRALRCFP